VVAVHAGGGDEQAALKLEQQVQEGYKTWSVWGPGSVGLRLYAIFAYRVPGMQVEMVWIIPIDPFYYFRVWLK
jgi:hypothetical protein